MALGSVVVRRDRTVAKDPAKGSLDSLAIYTVRDGLIARLEMAPREGDEAAAVALATRQLAAYNAQELDEHCACFAEDIAVSDLGGAVSLSGISAYRARYAAMFAQHPQNHAELVQRVSLGSTVIDHERVRRAPRGRAVRGVRDLHGARGADRAGELRSRGVVGRARRGDRSGQAVGKEPLTAFAVVQR
jgi:hypothetical protein